MGISVLTTVLAMCLLAFAVTVNSKSIKLDSNEIVNNKSQEDLPNIDNRDNDDDKGHSVRDHDLSYTKDKDFFSYLKSAEETNEDTPKEKPYEDSSDSRGDESEQLAEVGDENAPYHDIPQSLNAHHTHKSKVIKKSDKNNNNINFSDRDIPVSQNVSEIPNSEVLNMEEVHKFIKNFLHMAGQMVMTAFEKENQSTTDREEVKMHVIDIISMIEQNMISVIDKVSESKIIVVKPPMALDQRPQAYIRFPQPIGPYLYPTTWSELPEDAILIIEEDIEL